MAALFLAIVIVLAWGCRGAPEPLPTVPRHPPPSHHVTPTPTLIPGHVEGSHVALVPSGLFRVPTPTPVLSERLTAASAAYASAWVLTPQEFVEVVAEAGWPPHLHGQALSVAMCESGLSPWAVGDSGRALGLFQTHGSPWFSYAGESIEAWKDPLVQARVAWSVYNYDLLHGYPAWNQWACRP